MKKYADNIYVAIVKSKGEFASFQLLGRMLSEYAERGIKNIAHAVYECKQDVVFPEKYGYLAVVYDDMPLISDESLITATELMDKKCLQTVAIGRGYITSVDNHDGAGSSVSLNFVDFLSVLDARTLRIVYNEMRKRIIDKNLSNGAVILGDAVIDDTATVHSGAVIEGCCEIIGCSEVCAGARVRSSRIEDSKISKDATVGPFSYIRLNSEIGEGARIGDFVEVKKSVLGAGVKAAHLSYIGDAEVGGKTNVGCGTVFCNYDGKNKHKTVVGEGVFIGANTNLVAPVTVGDGAFIAAGTTVTDDLENDTFCIGRVRQSTRPKRK